MVLKKSNSGFNSGATQRVASGGTRGRTLFYRQSICSEFIQDNYVIIARECDRSRLYFHNPRPLTREQTYIYQQAEEVLMEFLDLHQELRSAKVQFVKSVEQRTYYDKLYGETFSLNKNKMWLLPDKCRDLKQNEDFARSISRLVDFRIIEIRTQYRINKRSKSLWRKYWSSFDRIEREKEYSATKLNNSFNPKSSKQKQQNIRGVQRLLKKSDTEKNKMAVEGDDKIIDIEKPKEILYMEIIQPFHIDARQGNLNLPFCRKLHQWYDRKYNPNFKSLRKCKHFMSQSWLML